MDRPVTRHGGRLLWSGEHWINALRPHDAEGPSAFVSLFHTRYSPAGEGNAAEIIVPGEGLSVICADSPAIGDFTRTEFFAKSSIYDPDARSVIGTFRRAGDVRSSPEWIIAFEGRHIVARWHVTAPPVIANGTFRPGTEHFTLLFFVDDAEVEVDGRRIEGSPYPREIWQKTIGGTRSSCVFALAETLIELPG